MISHYLNQHWVIFNRTLRNTLQCVGTHFIFPNTKLFIQENSSEHDDVIKWKHFLCYWIHRSPVNSPHKGQWRGALRFTLISARIKGWVNNREAGDLRCHRARYDVIVMNYPLQNGRHSIQEYMSSSNIHNTFCLLPKLMLIQFSYLYAAKGKRQFSQQWTYMPHSQE